MQLLQSHLNAQYLGFLDTFWSNRGSFTLFSQPNLANDKMLLTFNYDVNNSQGYCLEWVCASGKHFSWLPSHTY
jgi:hypothetical protein